MSLFSRLTDGDADLEFMGRVIPVVSDCDRFRPLLEFGGGLNASLGPVSPCGPKLPCLDTGAGSIIMFGTAY